MNEPQKEIRPVGRVIIRAGLKFVDWRVKKNKYRISRRLVALNRWCQAQEKHKASIAKAKEQGIDMSWLDYGS